jgi:DNA-binding protein HU-beta
VYLIHNYDQNSILTYISGSDFCLLSNPFDGTQKACCSFKQGIEGGVTLMNQAELITAVSERAGLTKADAGKAVEALVGTITEALTRGDEIRISGFGSFGISERTERQGRNPQTGKAITIAASKAAKFTAAKAVKDALNGG